MLEAAGSKWNFLPFRPGLVGGHCIGVDPYYLTHKAQEIGYHPEMILAGRRINDNMALLRRGRGRAPDGGEAHPREVLAHPGAWASRSRRTTPDLRNSKVADVVAELAEYGAQVDVWDPWVSAKEAEHEYGIRLVKRPARGRYDAIVLAVGHREFAAMRPAEIRRLAKRKHVLYDVKYLFERGAGRRRLRTLMRVLVTGAAGFIGYHVAERLLARGDEVIGLDNLNAYYDPTLKQARLARLQAHEGFRFEQLDLADRAAMEALFANGAFQRVVHLAAQAGVRYSIENPHAYVDSNLTGTLHVLEGCRHHGVEHLVFASTSSVYGANTKMPFSVHQNVDHPLSFYAATKKANELMAHTYASLYGLPVTGLRFFTVYGPWGRPDMALFLFTRNILAGKPIDVFNYGNHRRDFTYVDDIAGGVVARARPRGGAESAVGRRQPGSRHEPRAVPALQHRQQPAGRADALHRGARELPRAQGGEEPAAAAGRRRARHLGRRRGPGARRRLSAGDAGRGGRREVRRLVPRLLPGRRSAHSAGHEPWLSRSRRRRRASPARRSPRNSPRIRTASGGSRARPAGCCWISAASASTRAALDALVELAERRAV